MHYTIIFALVLAVLPALSAPVITQDGVSADLTAQDGVDSGSSAIAPWQVGVDAAPVVEEGADIWVLRRKVRH